jgi:hypothetical protein
MSIEQKSPLTPFEIGSFALSPRFPGLRFASQAEFREFLDTGQSTLDARYEYEMGLATREQRFTQGGTCAPCLRPAVFTAAAEGGELLRDGRLVPNWRETLHCDCRDPLSNRQRALLHFVQATGVLPWARMLLLGVPGAADIRLAALVGQMEVMRPFVNAPEGERFHMAVSQDYLQHVPQLDHVFSGLRERLLDGGRFIFTVPFHHGAAASELIDLGLFAGQIPSEVRGRSHRLGWDVLDMLRQAGFRDAAAYLYWSEELGYLGPMNFIFRAVR